MRQPGVPLRRTRALAALALAAAAAAALPSCDGADEGSAFCRPLSLECPEVLPSYVNEVAPIIARHCAQCHTAEDPQGPWPFDDPTDVADWRTEIQLDLQQCLMPPRDTDAPLGAADRQTLFTWLNCGAPLD